MSGKPLYYRSALFLLLALLATASIGTRNAFAAAGWEGFKTEFLSADGRIIDYGQGEISHSEGQAYALLLAEIHDDRLTFDRVLQWTMNNLAKRPDGLLAWKWGKDDNNQWRILDDNNATDGDLITALALVRAAARWKEPLYADKAKSLARSMRENLSREWQGHLLLLPGKSGFENGDKMVVNPSYILPAAYTAIANIEDREFWNRCAQDGEKLSNRMNFGYWGLPADWVELSDNPRPLPGRGEFFSLDAIRVLLVRPERVPGTAKLTEHSIRLGLLPFRVDLVRDTVAIQEANAGSYFILANAARASGSRVDAIRLLQMANNRRAGEHRQYFSKALELLAETDALR
jgi:endoglucanase